MFHHHVTAAARATLNAWMDRVGIVVGLGLIVGGALICLRAWWKG